MRTFKKIVRDISSSNIIKCPPQWRAGSETRGLRIFIIGPLFWLSNECFSFCYLFTGSDHDTCGQNVLAIWDSRSGDYRGVSNLVKRSFPVPCNFRCTCQYLRSSYRKPVPTGKIAVKPKYFNSEPASYFSDHFPLPAEVTCVSSFEDYTNPPTPGSHYICLYLQGQYRK